ncbi:hypothetical protein JW899_00185 [Candidatus Uhrbacteria bacterium]|nr:hypothetical protein [Candidatus Uhrbacteria bacterium]
MEFTPSREGQLTERQIKWGYWWVSHKLQLKAALTVLIGISAFGLLSYGIYGFADWFFGSGVRERAEIGLMATTPTGYLEINRRVAPQEPIFSEPSVLLSGSGSYDIYSTVDNPNADWILKLSWHFEADGQPVGNSRQTTVLPLGSAILSSLSYRSEVRPGQARLVLDGRRWQRLDKHVVRPDYPTWSGERLDLRVSDVSFNPPAADDPLTVSRAKFTVTNATGYGYWRVGFHVVLWGGTGLVGVNYVTVGELRPGESRPVDASWFTALPPVNRVEVIPEIDIFDADAYMPVGR